MALINAKEAEHDALKVCGDNRDLMQTAAQKWAKVAANVSKAGFFVRAFVHYGGSKRKSQSQFLETYGTCSK
jgi:hypothetical protein